MTDQILQKMNGFSGVAPGERPTVSLPVGPLYRKLLISVKSSGTALSRADLISKVGDITVMLNGKSIRHYTAAELLAIESLAGIDNSDGEFLTIYFERSWMETHQGQDFTALGTGGLQSFQVEVELKTITAPSMEIYAQISPGRDLNNNQPIPPGHYVDIRRQSLPVNTTGVHEVTDIPREDGRVLQAVHIGTDSVASVELHANGVPVFASTPALLNKIYKERGWQPQPGYTSVLIGHTRRMADVQTLGRVITDLRLKIDFTATGLVPLVVETIRNWGR